MESKRANETGEDISDGGSAHTAPIVPPATVLGICDCSPIEESAAPALDVQEQPQPHLSSSTQPRRERRLGSHYSVRALRSLSKAVFPRRRKPDRRADAACLLSI
eukprot:scaffold12459_cov98-Phaeocystis_antarctica.AAC.3